MKRTTTLLAIAAIVVGSLVLPACNSVAKDASKSPTMLIVQSVLGKTSDGQTAAFLQSDVQDLDFVTAPPTAFVVSDTAQITLTASLINPAPDGASQFNNITLTGYQVSYSLPGGGGVAGVDVPAPIGNSLSTLLVQVGKSVTVPFVVVLDTAKLAAPLAALVGTSNTIQVNALIEFTGQDITGKEVKASGSLAITFADYLDLPPAIPVKK